MSLKRRVRGINGTCGFQVIPLPLTCKTKDTHLAFFHFCISYRLVWGSNSGHIRLACTFHEVTSTLHFLFLPGVISLLEHNEDYVITFPSTYCRCVQHHVEVCCGYLPDGRCIFVGDMSGIWFATNRSSHLRPPKVQGYMVASFLNILNLLKRKTNDRYSLLGQDEIRILIRTVYAEMKTSVLLKVKTRIQGY